MEHRCTVYLLSVLIAALSFGCRPQSSRPGIRLEVDMGRRHAGAEIRLLYQDSSWLSVLDSAGRAGLEVRGMRPAGYATLFLPSSIRELYLQDGEAVDVRLEEGGRPVFGGDGRAVNEYLNSGLSSMPGPDAAKDEAAYIQDWEAGFQRLYGVLDTLDLPEDFKGIERRRLYYAACNLLLDYPLHHARTAGAEGYEPGSPFYACLERVMKTDTLAEGLWAYRQAFKNWLVLLCTRDWPQASPEERLRRLLDGIGHHAGGRDLPGFLAYTFLSDHIQHYGLEVGKGLFEAGMEGIDNPRFRNELETLYREHARLMKGKPAPDFILKDVEGREVALSAFRGSYVYLDVWASWCRPCCREIPHLQELERGLAGKPLVFVGISIDEDVEAWKSKVEKEGLSGVQLHAGRGSAFTRDYKVRLIPRFVLIDREGRILDARMTRPSDPETRRFLESLEGM